MSANANLAFSQSSEIRSGRHIERSVPDPEPPCQLLFASMTFGSAYSQPPAIAYQPPESYGVKKLAMANALWHCIKRQI
jgi:hypothetical protein